MGITLDQFMGWAPAWLQAVGALGTIYGGFRVVRTQAEAQRRLELQRERRQDVRRLQAVMQAAEISTAVWSTAKMMAEAHEVQGAHSLLAAVDDLKLLLGTLPIAELPHIEGIKVLHMQITACGQMAVFAKAVGTGQKLDPGFWLAVIQLASATLRDAQALGDWSRRTLAALQAQHDV